VRWWRPRRLGIAATIGAPAAVAAVLLALAGGAPGGLFNGPFGFGAPGSDITCPGPAPPRPYAGLSPGTPWESSLLHFASAARVAPRLVVSYVPFGSDYSAAHACLAAGDGGMLMVQMNPRDAPMAAIADGGYDRYLTRFARQIRHVGAPVVLSFAHEMNGAWYPWGFGHTDPAVFIAAWRHVHQVVDRTAGRLVTWCWNVNRFTGLNEATVSPPSMWWPGRGYVDWVGVDAYYQGPASTFDITFGSTFAQVRTFTRKPILIAETAIGPGPGRAARIAALFAGVRRRHLVGVVWFDINRLQQWRIDGDPAALAAFRVAAQGLSRPA
jgi:hypothetical protein